MTTKISRRSILKGGAAAAAASAFPALGKASSKLFGTIAVCPVLGRASLVGSRTPSLRQA